MSFTRIRSRGRTNRKFSLLGTSIILFIAMFESFQIADIRRELHAREADRDSMQHGGIDHRRSHELDVALDGIFGEISDFEERMVNSERLEEIQTLIMEIAKQSQCKLRRAVSDEASTVTWDTTESVEGSTEMTLNSEESPFEVTTQQLSLSLEGDVEQTRDLIARIKAQGWLFKYGEANFSRKADQGDQVAVELVLSFYHLSKKEQVENPWDSEIPPDLPPDPPD